MSDSKSVDLNHIVAELRAAVNSFRTHQEGLRQQNEEHFRFLAARNSSLPTGARSPRISRPVFVLGCVRSGTTAVGLALQQAGLPGWSEGHIFPLLHLLKQNVDRHYERESPYLQHGWGVSHLQPDVLLNLLADHFEQLHLNHHLSTRWVDKTPGQEMIEAAPYLLSLWPQAKFIFCRRRGIENVKSQLRRFSDESGMNISFEESCNVWTRNMEMWLVIRDALDQAYVEIDQGEMAKDPARIAANIGDLLGLTSSQTAAIRTSLREHFPEQTSSTHAAESLEDTGWTPEQKDIFRTTCGPAMQAFGYELGGCADAKLAATILLPFTDDPAKVTLQSIDGPNDYRANEPGAFLLHPPMSGAPATVTHRALSFHGHGRFFGHIELRHRQSQPVLYRVRIKANGGDAVLVDEHRIIEPGKASTWQFDFPPLSGLMDVSLSTEMAPGTTNNFYAWANWIGPRFLIK